MSDNHVLEYGNSEEEERRVSLNKKELENIVIPIVNQLIHQVLEQNIVPMISRTVKQEVESAVETLWARLNNYPGIGVQSSGSRTLQLLFLDKLSQPVLTNQTIKGEGNTPLRVALVDVDTKQVVSESSAKVEIVVVDGDFYGKNWTLEEFNKKIVREREGKKSLLTGNVHLNLESGVGFIREISFTHNSYWMKVCKLRLGAKVLDSFIGPRIREAVTEPFVLKDYRKTYSDKPSVPSLNDEVWRLKKIGRDGPLHKRLVRENIKSVQDFLTRFFIDPQSLRNIIGTAKTWEATVEHARKCVIDKRLNLYFPTGSEKKYGVVFNVVGQVLGLILECHYVPLDMLAEDQKADANKLVVSALEPMKEVKSFNDEICMYSYLQSLNGAYLSNLPRLEISGHYSCEVCHTDYRSDHTQPSTFSPDNQLVPFNLPDDSNPSNIPSTDSLHWSVPSFERASHLNEYGWQNIVAEDLITEGPFFSP